MIHDQLCVIKKNVSIHQDCISHLVFMRKIQRETGPTHLQIPPCKYCLDLCNNSIASLNGGSHIDHETLILSQNTMEWTILQSKIWHCRKNVWHSSFIMLIGEINSHLCFPWLPLRHISGLCCVANLQVYHLVFMQTVKSTGQWCWHKKAVIVDQIYKKNKKKKHKHKKGHYQSPTVSKPIL